MQRVRKLPTDVSRNSQMPQLQSRSELVEVLKGIAWIVGVVALFALVGQFLLLVFATALIAVALTILARAVERWTGA